MTMRLKAPPGPDCKYCYETSVEHIGTGMDAIVMKYCPHHTDSSVEGMAFCKLEEKLFDHIVGRICASR